MKLIVKSSQQQVNQITCGRNKLGTNTAALRTVSDTATELIMATPVILVFVFISTMAAGTVADAVAFRTYAGLENQVGKHETNIELKGFKNYLKWAVNAKTLCR